MLVKVNGSVCELPDDFSIQQLIALKNLSGNSFLVDLNRNLVPYQDWGNTRLKPDDVVEFIRILGGG